MHICDIFAIIASYPPKSRLNWGGFAKSRLNKRHLGERTSRPLTWKIQNLLIRGRDAHAPSWRSSPGRGLSPVVSFYNFENRLKPFYAVIAFSLLGPTSDYPRFFSGTPFDRTEPPETPRHRGFRARPDRQNQPFAHSSCCRARRRPSQNCGYFLVHTSRACAHQKTPGEHH